MKKFLTYLTLIILIVLQTTLFPHLRIMGVIPNLVLVFAGLTGYPNPGAAQLNDDALDAEELLDHCAEFFRHFFYAAGLAGRICVGFAVLLSLENLETLFIGCVDFLHCFGAAAVVRMCGKCCGAVCLAELVESVNIVKHNVYLHFVFGVWCFPLL